MTENLPNILNIKVTLENMPIPVWRQILVSEDTKLNELHRILQVTFGWLDEHLHVFSTPNGKQYAEKVAEIDGAINTGFVQVKTLLVKPQDTLTYEYDLGDGWKHTIELIDIYPHNEFLELPIVINGQSEAPPEDCGGPAAYAELLTILASKKDPQYKEVKKLFGSDFDPHAFNVNPPTLMLHPEIMQMLAGDFELFEDDDDEDFDEDFDEEFDDDESDEK